MIFSILASWFVRCPKYLSKVHYRRRNFTSPCMLALGTTVPRLPIAMHDGLQDGGEGSHSDASSNEYCMLCSEYVAGRSTIWTIKVDLYKVRYNYMINFKIYFIVNKST